MYTSTFMNVKSMIISWLKSQGKKTTTINHKAMKPKNVTKTCSYMNFFI